MRIIQMCQWIVFNFVGELSSILSVAVNCIVGELAWCWILKKVLAHWCTLWFVLKGHTRKDIEEIRSTDPKIYSWIESNYKKPDNIMLLLHII